MNIDCNLKDLQTLGFVVIKKFLSDSDVESLRRHHLDQQNQTLVQQAMAILQDKTRALMQVVRTQTDISVDTLVETRPRYYATGQPKPDSPRDFWHQDAEHYFLFQDNYQGLHLWVAIEKPAPNQSGIELISYDRLSGPYADIASLAKGRGTCEFRGTEYTDEETGHITTINNDLDGLGQVPNVDVGDLLVMRTDMIHRRQINTGSRISLGLRCVDSNHMIRTKKFLDHAAWPKHSQGPKGDLYRRLQDLSSIQDSILVRDLLQRS